MTAVRNSHAPTKLMTVSVTGAGWCPVRDLESVVEYADNLPFERQQNSKRINIVIVV